MISRIAIQTNQIYLNDPKENRVYYYKKEGGGDRETSQYLTMMDYSHVKRRPPIHNKSLLPAAP